MAIKSIPLGYPTKQDGQYKTIVIPSYDGLSSVYIDAGKFKDGVPYCWELVNFHTDIVASADVANRAPFLLLLNEYQLTQGGLRGPTVTASNVGSWDVMSVNYLDANSSAGNTSIAGIGSGWVVQGNGRLNVFWLNGHTNDVVNYHFMFKWLKPVL